MGGKNARETLPLGTRCRVAFEHLASSDAHPDILRVNTAWMTKMAITYPVFASGVKLGLWAHSGVVATEYSLSPLDASDKSEYDQEILGERDRKGRTWGVPSCSPYH
jgi:hypothetical protein